MTDQPKAQPEAGYFDVVFDGGPPGPRQGRFVECQDPQGASISVGEWIERRDGHWALRIPRAAETRTLTDIAAEASQEVSRLNAMTVRPEPLRDMASPIGRPINSLLCACEFARAIIMLLDCSVFAGMDIEAEVEAELQAMREANDDELKTESEGDSK